MRLAHAADLELAGELSDNCIPQSITKTITTNHEGVLMTMNSLPSRPVLAAIVLALGVSTVPSLATSSDTAKRPLELTDVMQFREIEQRVVSDNGEWLAFAAVPDFGDSEGVVVNTSTTQQYSVARADQPQINADGSYVAFRQRAPLLVREQAAHSEADDEQKEAAKQTDLVVLATASGEQQLIADVERFAFTGDGTVLVRLHKKTDKKDLGHRLVVQNLESGDEERYTDVVEFHVAEAGSYVAFTQAFQTSASDEDSTDTNSGEDAQAQRLVVVDTQTMTRQVVQESESIAVNAVQFNHRGDALAWLSGPANSDNPHPNQHLYVWRAERNETQLLEVDRDGFILSEHRTPSWSEDGQRIFIGYRMAQQEAAPALSMPQSNEDLYQLSRLTDERRLQVWHGNDDRIVTHQRETYASRNRATTPAVVWVDSGQVVALGDDIEDSWRQSEHSNAQLISNGTNYLREITWNGFYHDVDHVDLHTGERQNVVSGVRSSERGSLSPDGRYVAYVQDDQYQVFDAQTGTHTPLATDVNVSWVDELQDRPMEASSYGVAGWMDDSSAFLAYDRFDIWKISLQGEAVRLTDGRNISKQFRIHPLTEALGFKADETLLVHSYSDSEKYHGFWSLDLGSGAFTTLIEGPKRYQFVDYIEAQQRILFTEEDFRQFPDLRTASLDFSDVQQLTNVNPQISQFKWGNAELVDWQTDDGVSLQGVVIKPDDYDASRTYPVMVYYYEQYSQRLHHFNQMKVNHRPNFPFYVGQDYVVFLPDMRYRMGAPGPSATESLVPGVEKLVELGIADPQRIGLHGHSWSGYKSAFVVTETDMFAAVVSGAPVANMTSAYTGIRWQTGLARQFQYETGQSRIGPSMYEDLDPYIKNSPVFYADQINTPMLIQFGDADGAVPWEQGIEYYLALRRLDKDVVMLHYEDEPHHLQQYANKVDYSIKMLEFFDHYLKGEPAPQWWIEGLPYQKYDK